MHNPITVENPKYLDLLAMVWVCVLLVSTIAASKLIDVWGMIVPGTIIVYSITYIFSDIFTEVYGYKATRRIIWTGMACLLAATVMLYAIAALPPAKIYTDQAAFEGIFKAVPLYFLATIGSYFAGEFTNSYTLAKLKIITRGQFLWLRTIGSTMAGMLADTTVYVLIAFAWTYSATDSFNMIASAWFLCVAYEALMTPVTYRMIAWLKAAEGLDVYDTHTNFNPFMIIR